MTITHARISFALSLLAAGVSLSAQQPARGGETRILQEKSGLPLVTVQITTTEGSDPVEAKMLVDSGAMVSILSDAFCTKHGVTKGDQVDLKGVFSSGTCFKIKIHALKVADQVLLDLDARALSSDTKLVDACDGVLGMDVLRKFSSVLTPYGKKPALYLEDLTRPREEKWTVVLYWDHETSVTESDWSDVQKALANALADVYGDAAVSLARTSESSSKIPYALVVANPDSGLLDVDRRTASSTWRQPYRYEFELVSPPFSAIRIAEGPIAPTDALTITPSGSKKPRFSATRIDQCWRVVWEPAPHIQGVLGNLQSVSVGTNQDLTSIATGPIRALPSRRVLDAIRIMKLTLQVSRADLRTRLPELLALQSNTRTRTSQTVYSEARTPTVFLPCSIVLDPIGGKVLWQYASVGENLSDPIYYRETTNTEPKRNYVFAVGSRWKTCYRVTEESDFIELEEMHPKKKVREIPWVKFRVRENRNYLILCPTRGSHEKQKDGHLIQFIPGSPSSGESTTRDVSGLTNREWLERMCDEIKKMGAPK